MAAFLRQPFSHNPEEFHWKLSNESLNTIFRCEIRRFSFHLIDPVYSKSKNLKNLLKIGRLPDFTGLQQLHKVTLLEQLGENHFHMALCCSAIHRPFTGQSIWVKGVNAQNGPFPLLKVLIQKVLVENRAWEKVFQNDRIRRIKGTIESAFGRPIYWSVSLAKWSCTSRQGDLNLSVTHNVTCPVSNINQRALS